MSADVVGVGEAVEKLLRSEGPLDFVELLASVNAPPSLLSGALEAMIQDGRVERFVPPDGDSQLYRIARKAAKSGIA